MRFGGLVPSSLLARLKWTAYLGLLSWQRSAWAVLPPADREPYGGEAPSVKPFVQQAYPIQPAVTAPIPGFEPASAPAPSVPAWQGRSIGTTKLRLVEFSAFLEQQRDPDSYNKHLFVHIGHANHSYSDPLLESVDIRQIYDKFPEKKGGLKELFGKGPQNAFFLVKFWVSKTLL
ncbi:transcriptional enhancer factor TEF-1 isoform X2 [Physeter macrocephalus]|uniref:Transcriptional enhancer factor TEF-1 isoform X2 n=1 Tax=Physeter macrocephalus TaxID=9755 RepID=A0A455B0S0_PHYMC|nr:transcriptional enhancer factor TEF-1 isoform X2 [Physeter catodon]|eukprot:XP_028342500.1 transcriptional enhancer factor TEF-1 isoform X2 [Physeter catodon]